MSCDSLNSDNSTKPMVSFLIPELESKDVEVVSSIIHVQHVINCPNFALLNFT